MDFKDIKRIIELMKSHELSEFELEEEGFRISAKRGNGGGLSISAPSAAAPAPVYVAGAPAAATASAPAAPAGDTVNGDTPTEDDKHTKITSPMVGTFYRSSSPDAESFVNVGDVVEEDTVVCIVEAMKVMNEIKAEVRGTVRKILVENATPVEYGEPLFLIEPA
jgi:acetyl-CoA carboxylase biotin carboxyl carrier protein